MGTLFDQSPRDSFALESGEVNEVFVLADRLSENENIPLSEAIKIVEIAEYSRRTRVMIQDGDIKDEQLSGLGELITKFIDRVDFIAKQIEDIKELKNPY